MIILALERFAYSPVGTFGQLTFPEFACYTVERPWLDNRRRESCIPEGEYPLVLGYFNRGDYPAYELEGVPDRSLIKIHVGNTSDDVLGCIAVGSSLGWVKGRWAVTSSRDTYQTMMGMLARAREEDEIGAGAGMRIRITQVAAGSLVEPPLSDSP